jgi:hypothetical protein
MPDAGTRGDAPNADRSRLRGIALLVNVIGALGSLALMIRAGERTPPFLLVIFVFWVLAPFAVLLWANARSYLWSAVMQTGLFWVTIAATLCSLLIYGELVDIRPPGAPNAFPWVIVPPVTMLIIAISMVVATRASRRPTAAGPP